ncbi:MAG: PstS family phosphate ABC transporter substrate-binding protein [Planctomycetota bacterium]
MRLTRFALLCIASLTLAVTGCNPASTDNGGDGTSNGGNTSTENGGEQNTSLSGQINIEGSSTVEPISNRAKEMFNETYPNVNVAVSGQGTGNGFKALAKKECDLSDASRPIKKKEFDSCKSASINFYEIPVAYDGLTVVVNNKNDFVKSLSVDQLKKIFREDMAAKTWKEVDPSWPDEKISIYSPGIASGTHDYFVEVIGKKDKKGHRSDEQTTLSEDDKLLVTGVKGDQYAIGFFGYSYFDANRNELQAVPIVNPKNDKPVSPSMDTIESGEYAPFSRPLFIYVNTESYQRAEVKEFVDFYLDNITDIVKKAGYVPLPQAVYDAGKSHIAKDMPGTHYLDGDDKREGGVTEVYKADNLVE